jgi:DNA-binding transcriptional ArsR family regulator
MKLSGTIQKKKESPHSASDDSLDERLGKALAHPMRVNILAAASLQRTISPGEFARANGLSVQQVSYHFRELEEKYDALKLVQKRLVGSAVEHRYRATRKALFGRGDWQRVPASVKGGLIGATLHDFNGVAVQAIQSGKLQARDDVVFAWQPLTLDKLGWQGLVKKLKATFAWGKSLEEEGAVRLAKTGNDGTTFIFALAGFEAAPSDQPSDGRHVPHRSKPLRDGESLDSRLAKALAHPIRVNILAAASLQRTISPGEFARKEGLRVQQVSYHFRELDKRYGALEMVEEIPVRGATEHRYRGTKRALFGEADWQKVPESIKGGVLGATLHDLNKVVIQALEAGTLQTRNDVVFTWEALVLDELGWLALSKRLRATFAWGADELEKEAMDRIAKTSEQSFTFIFALAGFEAAKPGSASGLEPGRMS